MYELGGGEKSCPTGSLNLGCLVPFMYLNEGEVYLVTVSNGLCVPGAGDVLVGWNLYGDLLLPKVCYGAVETFGFSLFIRSYY